MRCPFCHRADDRVVDSRTAEGGAAIRRRRECARCGRRFTTYERVEDLPLVVLKRSGSVEPFSRDKVLVGVRKAAVNRPGLDERTLARLAATVESRVREDGPEVRSEEVGLAVLECLRDLDDVAYLRFASVYKGFEDVADFEREAQLLQEGRPLEKTTAPKGVGE
jgi:transcriptional repressor NrdR